MIVTIIPKDNFDKESVYYLSFTSGLKDYSGNNLVLVVTTFMTLLDGVEKIGNKPSAIRIYPNPASSKINIQTESF